MSIFYRELEQQLNDISVQLNKLLTDEKTKILEIEDSFEDIIVSPFNDTHNP